MVAQCVAMQRGKRIELFVGNDGKLKKKSDVHTLLASPEVGLVDDFLRHAFNIRLIVYPPQTDWSGWHNNGDRPASRTLVRW